MDLALPRRLPRFGYRRLVTLGSITMSCGLTAVMSLLFHREVRLDMIATGFVCAVIIDRIIGRVAGHYRRRLAEANRMLEQRVAERTAELRAANTALETAAAQEATLREELTARDRMAAAGLVAHGVSHEIRTPLSVITIALEELTATAAPGDADLLADASEAARRIATILRDLSSLVHRTEDPIAPTPLAPVIETAARLASYRLGKGTTLIRKLDPMPPVMGNSSRLVQVLLNLIVNAARATSGDRTNAITIQTFAEGDQIEVRVADTGVGMSDETRQRVFDPFYTTGAARGGTGLGLTICRDIIERLGGTIAIDSKLGVGTTVTLRLARAVQAGTASS